MTITIFVKPETFMYFLEVTKLLETLELENNYKVESDKIVFSEGMISNWIWINMDIKEYLKLKYCIGKLII